jgi:pyroglutamyl-peptidase
MNTVILVSAFEPFDGLVSNPSALILERLKSVDRVKIAKILLPVEFKTGFLVLKKQIQLIKPHFVISLGVARNLKSIALERVAVNLMDAKIPDNKGYSPYQPCIENEEESLQATIDIESLSYQLLSSHHPIEISNSAGTYVCNDVMFRTLHFTKGTPIKTGFIHVPMNQELDPTSPFILNDLVHTIQSLLSLLKDDP